MNKARSDQVAGGVFLIGLGILFFTHIVSFWPGILFVIGASLIARDINEERDWRSASAGLWMIGLGLVFLLGFSWPILLILIGLAMLFGYNFKSHSKRKHDDDYVIVEKPKNDEKLKTDDFV